MTLEEALAEIEKQKETIAELQKNAGKNKGLSEDELKKIEQKAYNQGFDKAKNQFESEKEGLLKREDVEKMLSEKDNLYKAKSTLKELGIKNPDRALKLIDEDDMKNITADDFKADDFQKKYGDVLVFGDSKKTHTPITIENKHQEKTRVTAEDYAKMSASEKAKVTNEQRAEMLK